MHLVGPEGWLRGDILQYSAPPVSECSAVAKTKLDVPTLLTLLAATALLAAGALYVTRLGANAEQNLPDFFAQLRWIIAATAALAFFVALVLARRLDALAQQTESQRKYPPDGIGATPAGVSEPCHGDAALMVAANLRGYALMALCLGIGAGLAGLIFALRL